MIVTPGKGVETSGTHNHSKDYYSTVYSQRSPIIWGGLTSGPSHLPFQQTFTGSNPVLPIINTIYLLTYEHCDKHQYGGALDALGIYTTKEAAETVIDNLIKGIMSQSFSDVVEASCNTHTPSGAFDVDNFDIQELPVYHMDTSTLESHNLHTIYE